jgi:hypothetical protein
MIERIKNIILKPNQEWDVIEKEENTLQKLLVSYVLPLSLIAAVCSFIGYGLIGYEAMFIKIKGINIGIHHALIALLSSTLSFIVCSFVVDALAPGFNSTKNINKAAQLVAYSSTPAYLAGIFNIIPALAILGIVGLYGLYLMYLGLPKMMKTPADKTAIYLIVIVATIILVYFIVGAIITALMPISPFGLM